MLKIDFLLMITVLLTLVIRFIYTLSFIHLHFLDLHIYTHTYTQTHTHTHTKALTEFYLYKPLLSIPIKYQQADKFYLGEIHLIRIIL